MKVVQVSVSDRRGGAAIAAHRLHRALCAQGIHSRFLTLEKLTQDEHVEVLNPAPHADSQLRTRAAAITNSYVLRNRTETSNTHFSLPLLGLDLCGHPAIQAAHVLHLHWVASLLTPATVGKLLKLGKPVVWTMHDMGAFTGGCHFTAGCDRFRETCSFCPQLRCDNLRVPAAVLQDKKKLWPATNLTVIAPSSWMAERVRESALLGSGPSVQVIPNGLDTKVFLPMPRQEACAALGISPQNTYLLAGTDRGQEKRKGLAILERVLNECLKDSRFHSAKTHVLWMGDLPENLAQNTWPVVRLDRTHDEQRMALVHAAADLFVLTSLEDNLPNMMLEALSCATPVVAFSVGGVPEVIQDGWNGRVVPAGDEKAMCQAALELVSNRPGREAMGQRGRRLIESDYSLAGLADRHKDLYRSLLCGEGSTRANGSPATGFPAPTDEQVPICSEAGPALQELLPQLTVQGLTDEVEYLNSVCADRLNLIKAQDVALKRAAWQNRITLASAIRFNDWWYSKIPPLLAVAYLQILAGGLGMGPALIVLGCLLFSIVCVASYGHVLNDHCDRKADARAGKSMARLKRRSARQACLVLLGAGFLPALLVDYSALGLGLLFLNYLWPSLYSLHGIRLKERGIWGVLCDAAGSHLTPALLVLTVFGQAGPASYSTALVVALAAWSCVLGIKGILNHQVADRENDSLSKTTTFAGGIPQARMNRFLSLYNVCVELPASLILVLVVCTPYPLAAAGLLFYCMVESIKYRLGFPFALNGNPRNNRVSVPFANDFFYELWFPLALAGHLALRDITWAWLPLLHAWLFLRTVRWQCQDLGAVAQCLQARARLRKS